MRTKITERERKDKRAAYMREYWKRHPDRYAAMLAQQVAKKTSTRTYQRNKDKPEFKEKKKVSDKTYYERNRDKVRNAQGGRTYGISADEYERRVTTIPCEICGILEPRERKRGCGMHIDHDHETGENRGVLCHKCNRALGSFGDDPERLEAAAMYVRRYRKERAA